ncbi:hypothetical protein D1007_12933 [Hordeum vulgare]|nr:hypothetical protein D1007_12933 [Hordeum vulgare]
MLVASWSWSWSWSVCLTSPTLLLAMADPAQPPVVAAAPAQSPVVAAPQAQGIMPLIHWVPVFERTKPSVFLILFTPVSAQAINARGIAFEANSKSQVELDQIFQSKWSTQTGVASQTNGFYLYILTTAHIVDYLFHAVNKPIAPATVNKLFTIEVTCFHAERDFVDTRHRVGDRTYTPATVCGIDCLRDLMMLRVDRRDLAMRVEGQQRVRCTRRHPVLQFSITNEFGMQCMLFSWSAFRPCTFATGLQCLYRCLSGMSTNTVGYDMELLEAYIGSEDGSSGGPLLNSAGQVKGILHGGTGVHSQFILSRYIIPFIVNNATPPEAQSTSSAPSAPRGPSPRGGRGGPKKDDRPGPSDPSKRRRSGVQDKGKAAAAGGSGRRYVLRSQGKVMITAVGGSGWKYVLRPRS